MVDKSSGDVVGAMYTQRVKDGELVDSVPWRESITMTAGIKGCSIDQNIDNVDGKVKQLMRVSTRGGGGDVRKYVVGTSLRDFALVVAASQGIDQVVRVVIKIRQFVNTLHQPTHFFAFHPLHFCCLIPVRNHTCQRLRYGGGNVLILVSNQG